MPSSCRPISLRSCSGKLFERIVFMQLSDFLGNDMLYCAQYCFTRRLSTFSNLLVCAAHVPTLLSNKHVFGIISFDFIRAFDKVPHHLVISALVNIGIRGAALRRFNSFLAIRFCVCIEQNCSRCGDIISGMVQGSVIGSAPITIFINLLLKKIRFSRKAFADDLKFIVNVIENNQEEIKQEVSSIVQWANKLQASLSVDKSSILHCGRQRNVIFIIYMTLLSKQLTTGATLVSFALRIVLTLSIISI